MTRPVSFKISSVVVSAALFVVASLALTGVAGAHHGEDEHKIQGLIKADREFSRMAQIEGVAEAFAAYLHPLAVQLGNGVQPVLGAASILPTFEAWPEGAGMTWFPLGAGVADSEDLGFTWGRYVYSQPGAEEAHGKYTTVWKKNDAGEWKVLLDMGNSNPPPED